MNKKRIYRNSIILSSLVIIFAFSIFLFKRVIYADPVSTSVSVNNAAPSFTVAPFEDETYTGSHNPSTSSTPTNQGANITFRATADDPDGNNYYLAICKTDAITPNNNAAPTCTGGSWCISSSTTDNTQASCNYTTLVSDDENNAWYAFVCDYSSTSRCIVTSSQGSGNSGSPFVVNHKPTFSSMTNDGPKDPGASIVFSSTASDSDTYDTTDDDLYLLVCSTSGITQPTPYSSPTCNGTEIARTTVSTLTDPTATFAIPNVYQDGTFTGNGYVYDNHYATTTVQTSSWTVNNLAPVVAIDSFSATTLTLTENTTTALTGNVTVSDSNSCLDITSGGSIRIDFYGNWLDGDYTLDNDHGYCDLSSESDGDQCYAEISCNIDSGTNGCSGSSDSSVAYDCIVNVQYYAEATGTGAIDTNHINGNWYAFVTATDNNSATDNARATNLAINLLVALNVDNSINYGALDAGEISTNKTTLVTATGNTIIDTELSGTNMTSGANSILVSQQKYSTATFDYATEGSPLSGTPTEVELNVPKTNWNGTLQLGTANAYWGLQVPISTPSGTYSGTNTVTAILGEW